MRSIAIEEVIKYFPKRQQDSNKGTFGRILNIAGSKNYTGAAILSSLAALKVGAGYVTLASVKETVKSVHAYTPDIPTVELKRSRNGAINEENTNSVIKLTTDYNLISIGCGLGQERGTTTFVTNFIKSNKKPIIIDADAINAISKVGIEKIKGDSIITPHPKELSRLIKVPLEVIQTNREHYAVETAKSLETIVVLKGHETIVTNGEYIYKNKTGCSALAKAGSGDILTGIIAGILAQTKQPLESAIIGVYLHGLTGDIAAEAQTEYSVLASELLNYIPLAIKKLH